MSSPSIPGVRFARPRSLWLAAAAGLTLGVDVADAQNPIASKVVGSEVARRNRRLIAKFRGRSGDWWRDTVALARHEVTRSDRQTLRQFGPRAILESRLAEGEVTEYLAEAFRPRTALDSAKYLGWPERYDCTARALGVQAPVNSAERPDSLSAVTQLERLCRSDELRPLVPEALRLALGDVYRVYKRMLQPADTSTPARPRPRVDSMVAQTVADIERSLVRGDPRLRDRPTLEVVAARALDRLLGVMETGHTNPQRWFLGGQLGLRLAGDEDDRGLAARASIRATYFVPVSPFHRWQLPIVTNLRDIASAADTGQATALKKVTTSSEGAYLSIEPTLDPISFGKFKDGRVQPFLAIGGQVNTLRNLADTEDVEVTQGRVGVGTNVEFGTPTPGRPSLFFTSRVIWRVNSPGQWERVFGTRNRGTPVIETIALVPIGGATSLLAEVSTTRNAKPVVRFGFWSQATPQGAAQGADVR